MLREVWPVNRMNREFCLDCLLNRIWQLAWKAKFWKPVEMMSTPLNRIAESAPVATITRTGEFVSYLCDKP